MSHTTLAPIHPAASEEGPPPDPAWQGWRGPVLLGVVIFCCALAGILSRPLNYAAALWIANPVLAGVMVRHPHLARSGSGWFAALVGFLAADLLTGSALLPTMWFTLANLAGGGICAWILLRGKYRTRFMQGQHSALLLFNAAFWGAVVSALVGAGTGPVLFQSALLPSAAMWLGGEFMGYILLLPVVLSLPRQWTRLLRLRHPLRIRSVDWSHLLPLAAVVFSVTVAVQVDNASVLALVVPALVWCALRYTLLSTSLLCLVVCLILTVEVAMGNFQFTPEYWQTAMSLRLGIALLALGPIAVASNRCARQRAMDRLDHTINHDSLTGLLSRSAFFQRAQQSITALTAQRLPVSLMVMDLDHFKRVNDTYGHPAGDVVLQQFAQLAATTLREHDLLGRMGGEEFLVLLPRLSQTQAQEVAQRLCQAVRSHLFILQEGLPAVPVTVSIGLVHCQYAPGAEALDTLIQHADTLLYRAKQQGRDGVVSEHFRDTVPEPDPLHHRPLNRRHASGTH